MMMTMMMMTMMTMMMKFIVQLTVHDVAVGLVIKLQQTHHLLESFQLTRTSVDSIRRLPVEWAATCRMGS